MSIRQFEHFLIPLLLVISSYRPYNKQHYKQSYKMRFFFLFLYQIVIAAVGKSVKKVSFGRSKMMISDSNATDCDKREESFVQYSRDHLNHVAGIHNEVHQFTYRSFWWT